MRQMILETEPFSPDQIPKMLREHGVLINHYAEEYFAHPRFSVGHAEKKTVTIASLQELGFENGATLDDIFQYIGEIGLKPCSPSTGLFLRLAWLNQPQSHNSILSGTHNSPDQAVTVLSEIIEQDDAFPRGLYLRNVDGNLWLRAYICDSAYRFPCEALFAFETRTI